MKKMEELRNYLLENYVDEDGDLNISHLDFSDFNGNVYISGMKVKGNLSQYGHEVKGSLIQSGHQVKGNLIQSNHEVQGYLSQGHQKAQGNLYNQNNKYGGERYENPSTKLLKVISPEELAELGYKLGYKLK